MVRWSVQASGTSRWTVGAVTVVSALTLVACGAGTEGGGAAARSSGDDVEVGQPAWYDCYGVSTTAAELEEAATVADLDEHPAGRAFARHADRPETWVAVEVEDERIGAIRPLDPPEVLDGEVRDHERLVVERTGTSGDGEADADGYMVSSAGPCALRVQLDGAQAATVTLDPDAPPDPAATSLSLWVIEQACASGQSATDRVVVDVEETDDHVRLIIGVRPQDGDQNCPSNPPTPVTIELDEPLGQRTIIDAARLPPIEVEDAPDALG